MDKKTTLVIMAAGLGTRYGEGRIKQLDPVGPDGEIIMDYSIYDAKAAGFDKIVFIIRPDIKQAFDEMIGSRINKHIETDYVYQQLSDVPEEYKDVKRTKPWGTGQAVLACRNAVKEPFAVINADDAYGRKAFEAMHGFLTNNDLCSDNKLHLAMPGFVLENTLSAEGSVTRGICTANGGMLSDITETYGIRRQDGGVFSYTSKTDKTLKPVDAGSYVSMNMWACPAEFIDTLEESFEKFLSQHAEDPDSEFLLPTVINAMIHDHSADCRLFETSDKWFGMTSVKDKAAAQAAILKNIKDGIYPEKLWT